MKAGNQTGTNGRGWERDGEGEAGNETERPEYKYTGMIMGVRLNGTGWKGNRKGFI